MKRLIHAQRFKWTMPLALHQVKPRTRRILRLIRNRLPERQTTTIARLMYKGACSLLPEGRAQFHALQAAKRVEFAPLELSEAATRSRSKVLEAAKAIYQE